MRIKDASFVKSVVDDRGLPQDRRPHVAFIGRSNVGKSSLINALTGKAGLARSSSTPGFTKEINFFLINNKIYLVDLPGYGYAQGSFDHRNTLKKRISWYLNDKKINQHKVILIIDAKVGPTRDDEEMLLFLQEHKKDIIIVANKIDKLNQKERKENISNLSSVTGPHKIIPFSATKKIGISALANEILN